MPAHIDTYDKLDWMQEALQSIQMQTFTDYEVIIIDDSSTIKLDVLQNEFKAPKFRWFKARNPEGEEKPVGPSTCRNTAVELSSSKQAILPLDADDLLPDKDVLNIMFTEWSNDKSKFYYGNMIKRFQGKDTPDRFYNMLQYSFVGSINPDGIMPVSCIHSYECWQAAGGWKDNLDAGREDVEYWIAAGKAGFCGQKIQETTLIYRRHETSRDYKLRLENRRVSEMINSIRLMHEDVYKGEYPMGCCGGEVSYTPPENNIVSAPSELSQYNENEKVWVEYAGTKGGNFGVNGPYTFYSYQIKGQGHKLQVHNQDLSRFKSAGRGQDFKIDVEPPNDYEIPGQVKPQKYTAPNPVLAMIENLDGVATG